jgi:hypothetical protein
MERRELLKAGIAAGAGLLAGDLFTPAEAGNQPRGKFYEGLLGGGKFDRWTLRMLRVEDYAWGYAHDPETSGLSLQGFVVAGQFKRRDFAGRFYAADDFGYTTPVGDLLGRVRGVTLAGEYQLDNQEGRFTVITPRLNQRLTRRLAHEYMVTARDPKGEVLFTGDFFGQSGGRYELADVIFPGIPKPFAFAGYYGVRRDGNKLFSLWSPDKPPCERVDLLAPVQLARFQGGNPRTGFDVELELSGFSLEFRPSF